jgi:sugar lactone lactonase YvrE
MKTFAASSFLDGFVFLEGPRWFRGHLWVSELMGQAVYRIAEDGARTVMVRTPRRPSGLGFLPDGTPLIVSMQDRRLYKLVKGELVLHADLSGSAHGDLNDMVVDSTGRAYVGNLGFNVFDGDTPVLGKIFLVEPDGSFRVAAEGLSLPNGSIITPDGRRLVVAESFAGKLTAFDRDASGNLSNGRRYAEFPERVPDGICLDTDGNIWVAEFHGGQFSLVDPAGTIIAAVDVRPHAAVACQLGGSDGRTLYCLVYPGDIPNIAKGIPGGRIDVARVAAPGAGSP